MTTSPRFIFLTVLFCAGVLAASPIDQSNFKSTSAEGRELLAKNPLLLEADGGAIIRKNDGTLVILGVGSTVIKKVPAEESGKERMRQRTVAENKARAKLLEQIKGAHIQSTTKSESKIKVISQNGQEFAETSDNLTEEIIATVSGAISGLEPLATWHSPEGDIFYTAPWKVISPR